MNTALGQVEINDISEVSEESITEEDAKRAGFENKKDLFGSFYRTSKGRIYKLGVSYHSEDPRIKLREQTELSEEVFLELKRKLWRLDKYSKKGHWTKTVFITIRNNPNKHAVSIAETTGFEKEWLKINIRKLKNLGLTISHNVGYEISPFGNVFLERAMKED